MDSGKDISIRASSQDEAPPLPAPPGPGEAVAIRPGLLWVRMPLEGPPWHVNCWLLADGPGWLVIDGGINRPATRLMWESVFARALGGRPVTSVLATHFHADHVGLAAWLCARWQAPLLMARTEFMQARLLLLETPSNLTAQQIALGEAAGAPADYLRHLLTRRPFYRPDVEPLPHHHRVIAAGQTLTIGAEPWILHVGRGHAPEMMLLHAPALGVLIAADQVLPRISPYVGVFPGEPEADPLADFLDSNRQLMKLPEATLVLPSHGDPFFGLHHRLQALATHHAERLALLEGACDTPRSAYDAARLMFTREFDLDQTIFVIGEGLAHINWLVARGRLVKETGADGVPRYRCAGGR
jgi:glyoxylase-like metal-dependent hydrolase (beta-lactamase superfamily II)